MTTTTAEGLWARSYHPAPHHRRQLVCFPHAGGSASFFFPVSAQLSSVAEVLSVQYPGRQDRRTESSPSGIEAMADQVYAALQGRLRSRPTAFFGHSMGAMVAFEVARRLEADGGELTHLFASGRRAPSRYRAESVHRRDDDGIVAELKLLSGTDAALLGDEELLRMILPAIRSDYTAVETYRCDPGAAIKAPITALTGDDDPKTTLEEAEGWRAHTTGAFDLRVYPGGHFFLSSQAQAVLALLREHLTAAEEFAV
ncbi:thioesterase II family protein [Streptomyces natalensis]|uniref:SgnI n=3 Tax=Streptomyces TaxID=1883 RepID=A0A1S6KDZ3_9ACTN|nr:alpha/beta fold hydrolase [Streptomyces natalensis]AQT01392.1 SgnI [Streptomyces gilvosporeus]KIZ15990.1 oleoyl-ACP hydrolase [Streptomyces natalensis ATCC 27448]CAC20922.1 PimI protein [Streptomyces natalensis]